MATRTVSTSNTRRFSRADVVLAGVEITGSNGFAELSLSAVADHLGTSRTSLYHHFPGGLTELRAAVVESVGEQLRDDGEPIVEDSIEQWQEQTLRRVGRASREYPGVLQYLLTAGSDERYTVAETDRLFRLLRDSGLDDLAVEAWVIVHAYITGWVTAHRPSARTAEEEGFETLAAALREAEKLDPDDILFDGLQALLNGLKMARLARNEHQN
ncbi:MAG: hypothetical protein JWM76_121 [Pseudonocardiales bacterium]|nr:hypothetical protein [Pseudonocardiales bacterium]